MRVLHFSLAIILYVCCVFAGNAQQGLNVKSKFSDVIFNESTKKKQASLDSMWANRPAAKVMSLGTEIVYTIPVVVHIIHNNGTENITDQNVYTAIQKMNDAFANANAFTNAQGVNVNVQFCLASQNASKQPSTGIDRVQNTLTNISAPAQDAALKALSYWPSDKYLNIWVVKEITGSGDPSVAGYATLPSAHGTNLDGLVVEARYFAGSNDDSKVTVHELGHYLGLYHTFEGGCVNNNCLQDGDQVCDTPPEGTDGILPSCTAFRNSCDTDDDDLDPRNPFRPTTLNGKGDQHDIGNNYMNYNMGQCQVSFTQGQKDRMRYFFETKRISLINGTACQPGCTALITPDFTISSPYNAGQTLTFTNTSVNATSYQWVIDGVNYATTTNTTKVFAAEGNYTIKLIASNSNPSCVQETSKTITVTCPITSSFTASATDIQLGQSVTFTSTGTAVSSYQWYINGVAQSGATASTFTYTFSTANTYLIQLKSNNGQCEKYSESTIVKTGECPKNKTSNIWYFGKHAGLDFNSGSPQVLTNGAIDSGEPAAAISDNNGNLLFYTDGITVWNKNHVAMPNGTNLKGHISSTHVLIVPKPGSSNIYYIFTCDAGGSNGFNYSIVDMNSNGSLGDVVTKNVQLLTASSEKVFGTFHSNGTDIWIVVKDLSMHYLSFLLTSSGISSSAPVSSVSLSGTSGGQIKISNNGSIVASEHYDQANLEILTFNNTTGVLSNPWLLTVIYNQFGYGYGLEFSPDNSKLYYSSGIGVIQIDLLAGSNTQIQNSNVAITGDFYTGMELGPDNKIYMTTTSLPASRYLGVIANPNLAGSSCNYMPNAVLLDVNNTGQNICKTGIITLFNTNFKKVLTIVGSKNACSGTSIKYSANTTETSTIAWSVTKGTATINSQTGLDAYVTFPKAGTYTLQATQNTVCGIVTSSFDIIVAEPFTVDLVQDGAICSAGGSYTNNNGAAWVTSNNYESLKWSTTPATYTSPYDYNFATNVPGKYWMEVSKGGCTARDEFTIFPYNPASAVNLGPDITNCANAVTVLDAGANYKTYLWSDGSTGQKFTTFKPGNYSVTVTDYCGGTATDQIVINNTPIPLTSAITGPSSVCATANNMIYSVTATTGSSYAWTVPPGATYTANTAGNQITVTFAGIGGQVTVTETITSSGCKGSTMVQPVTISNSVISITTNNNNTEPTVLIPTCHPSVVLNASSGFVSYTWYRNGLTIAGGTNSTYTATQSGDYTVQGIDANSCIALSDKVTVIEGITITGDDKICPGEKASLQVTIDGVIGNYFVQWFQNGSTTSTTAPSGTAGVYSAIVVLPTFASCTLTTPAKLVDMLLAPSPYTVDPQGPLYICSGDAPVTLSATAPSSTPVSISSYSWNTGEATQTISTNIPGYYNITTLGSNGCSSLSNSVLVLAPTIAVTQHCNSDGTTKLTANQNINGTNYVWKNSAGATVGTTQSINVSTNDTYTVTSNDTRCNAAASALVCTPTQTNLGTNLVTNGDFNISATASPVCFNYAVNSDLTCSDATTTPLNAGNWPSNFKITSNAGAENQNKWLGTGFVKTTDPTDIYCLIADGRVTDQKQRVWYQQVAVENCATYTFSIFVKNIIINEAEIPKVSLKIGNYTIKSKTLYANQPNWVELSGTWRSNVTGNVEISVLLDGGGWVGRDIAIDEIYFAKTNCMKATPIGRNCNAIVEVGVDKFICSGQNVQIGDNQNIAGLTYSWTGPGGYTSTVANPTVNPTTTGVYTLTVTDNANNCSATDYVAVNVIVPAVTITKDITTTCSANQVKASLFNGVPNVQYEWQVNNSPVTTNTTGIFSLSGVANGATVRCRLVTACSNSIYSNSITVGTSAPVAATQTTICSGTSTQLHANMSGGTAPFTYTWSASAGAAPDAVSDPIVSPTAPTTYSLTYKDANNCTYTGSVYVFVNASPSLSIGATSACEGSQVTIGFSYGANNTLTSYTLPSSLSVYNGTGSNGSLTYYANVVSAGTSNIVGTAKSPQGCSTTKAVSFTAFAKPVPMTISISNNPACVGSGISVSVNYGVGNTLVSFTDPPTISRIGGGGGPGGIGFSANVVSSGTGNFVGLSTNAQGCSTTVSVPFTALPEAPVITSTGSLICSGSPILLSTDLTGTGYQWYNGATLITGATNNTYKATAAGTYTIQVTGSNACSNTSAGTTLTTSTLAAPRVHVDDATDNYCASAPVAMKVGTALQLNGTTQYVNVPSFNFPASGTTYGGPITVEFWVNTTGVYGSGFSIGGLNTTGNRAQAHVPGSDGSLYWDYGSYSGTPLGRISAPFSAYIGKWTHVAFVSAGNGGNFKAIYINGVQAASSTAASDGPNVQLNGLTIGKWMTYYTGGMMDEFRIWNKVLSTAEIQAAMTTLYESGTPNLMGSWGFDEASGTTVNNDAFSAQTGTLMNSATRVYPSTGLTYTWTPSAFLNTGTGTSVTPNTTVVRTYTVQGVDANGCSAYAQVVATPNLSCRDADSPPLAEMPLGWDVNVYPNPTAGEVHITFLGVSQESNLSIEVIGMDGAVILQIDKVEVNQICNVHDLPSGLYLIRVKNGEEIKTKKVVVVK